MRILIGECVPRKLTLDLTAAGHAGLKAMPLQVKQNVITIEKTMGRMKRYLQLTTVMAAKQRANAHAVPRMSAKVATGRPASCHASIAANR
ncbi:MAG TPA: hypothetical protein VKT33_03525 [Candidatus Angelobacter sp.]|nr:hypothetical protein [Candidatus Angelobacter sp.]